MDKTLIDTSYIIALIVERDENHEKAMSLVEEYDRRPLLITDAVLLEIGNALAQKYKSQAVEIFEEFIADEDVEIVRLDESLFEKAFELYKSYEDKTWGLVDCVSFVVMRENGMTDALTADKHFVQAGFRALMLDLDN